MKYLLVVAAALTLLAACGRGVPPAAAPINIDATVNARVQATQAAAQVATQSPAATPVPSAPSSTPLPPPATPTPSPIPPTATPTPDPRLFWDDFEAAIKKEWHMTGDNFLSANGKLTVVGKAEGAVGDSSWTDYAVTLGPAVLDVEPRITLLFRIQDRDNYMKMFCERRGDGYGDYFCDVLRVINGTELRVPGTPFVTGWGQHTLKIEANGPEYRLISDDVVKYRFIDETFTRGGVKLQIESGKPFELESFDVRSLSSSARPVQNATPASPNLLFVDDFNYGIKPDWNMTGDNFVSGNGRLMSTGFLRGAVGSSNWTDYRITLDKFNDSVEPQVTVLFRVQDSDNYMKLYCERRGDGYGAYFCDVFKVVSGQAQLIPGTPFSIGWAEIVLGIEAEGEVYRFTVNNEVTYRFTDSTFSKGGVVFQAKSREPFALDAFEVRKLP